MNPGKTVMTLLPDLCPAVLSSAAFADPRNESQDKAHSSLPRSTPAYCPKFQSHLPGELYFTIKQYNDTESQAVRQGFGM